MESPQELRERLKKEQIVMQEKVPHELIYPAGAMVELQIEQVCQLSRIAFRLIDVETQLRSIGEILEDKQK